MVTRVRVKARARASSMVGSTACSRDSARAKGRAKGRAKDRGMAIPPLAATGAAGAGAVASPGGVSPARIGRGLGLERGLGRPLVRTPVLAPAP